MRSILVSDLNTKGTKRSFVVEAVERDVEDLGRDSGDDTAEERLPAQRLGPEGRQVFHGE